MITQKELIEILIYCPDTGIFRWKIKVSRKNNIGAIAGHLHRKTGYIRIIIKGKQYRANRLAWLYMTGEWPKNQVDHKNKVRHDNIWLNLRDLTNRENCNNRVKPIASVLVRKTDVSAAVWSKVLELLQIPCLEA